MNDVYWTVFCSIFEGLEFFFGYLSLKLTFDFLAFL